MTAVLSNFTGARMLSPPYSPHTDPSRTTSVVTKSSAECRISVLSRANSASTSSDDDETDSESVHSGKRSAFDAFSTDSSQNVSRIVSRDSESPADSVAEAVAEDTVLDACCSPLQRERRMTTCWDALKSNPRKYLKQERGLLDMYPLRRHSWAGPSSAGLSDDGSDFGSAASASAASPASNGSNRGVGRGRKAGRPGGRRRRTSVQLNAPDSGSRQSPAASDDGTDAGGFAGSGMRVHDLSFHELEDYSPNLSLLPPGKSLRAEWKGAPMDLSGDPDLPRLHPAEAHLASVLRLPCDVYLDSKRRLFAEKVHRLRQGLPFRRTDSQKACRIDVNKASRLFGAFEKIGWLEDELFMKFLD